MEIKQLLKLEEQTLRDLYNLSIKQKEVDKLKSELREIEKDMFGILTTVANSINEIIKTKEMPALKEIIDKHNFLQLVTDSKQAMESSDRDFIESVEKRVRFFDWDITKLSELYGIRSYRAIEELENIEEKLKFEHEYGIKNPLYAILIILIWNSRVLHNSLSSRAVWLSYKKP